MTTTYTTNISLGEPSNGSLAGTWDVPVNNNSSILDQVFGQTTSVSFSTPSVASTTIITSPAVTGGNTSQCMRFSVGSGQTLAANQIVLVPQSIAGMWVFTNGTSGAYTVTIGVNNGSGVAAGNTLTIPQSYSSLLFSDGTNIYKADDGILQSITSLTLSGTLTVNGTTTLNGSGSTLALILKNAAEPATISATAATGTINYDVLGQSILYYTTNASGNFTINIRGNGSNTFNSITSTGQVVTIVFLNTNGNTAYYNNAVTIDGTSVTPKWQGGIAPSAGDTNSIDVYTYTIIKTSGAPAYTVLASATQFA